MNSNVKHLKKFQKYGDSHVNVRIIHDNLCPKRSKYGHRPPRDRYAQVQPIPNRVNITTIKLDNLRGHQEQRMGRRVVHNQGGYGLFVQPCWSLWPLQNPSWQTTNSHYCPEVMQSLLGSTKSPESRHKSCILGYMSRLDCQYRYEWSAAVNQVTR